MGIRQTMNENPGVSIGVTAGVILLVIIVIVWELAGGKKAGPAGALNQTFFSTDDGKTYFADDSSKLPPFMKDGKPAYKAVVFRCGNGQPFVAHLERFTEEGKKRAEEARQKTGRTYGGMGMMSMLEVKKPGQPNWVRLSNETSKQWSEIMKVTCPDGGSPEPVLPGQ